MPQDKRTARKIKRSIKKAGQKRLRQQLKCDLRDNPHDAHLTEPTFGNASSETLNGLDQDGTRRKK